ncbi:hypothetical protein KSP40_PGU015414 [Platanthera guangdongensis]|uniref:Ribosomal protein S20 n=1 Tax=Platanthera guangdongensis TaxID=2320717 RepID=A0ABR2M5K1_9ASPA
MGHGQGLRWRWPCRRGRSASSDPVGGVRSGLRRRPWPNFFYIGKTLACWNWEMQNNAMIEAPIAMKNFMKVFKELDVLKKKVDAKAEEILSVEKLISEAYSAIDKAVKSGTLHKNTGAHRKSRLARRKKSVEIHHAWYTPTSTATA